MTDAELARAVSDAIPRAALLLSLLRAQGAPAGLRVPLGFFATPHDYETMRPGDDWTWQHYAAVLNAVVLLLNGAGYRAELAPVRVADCLAWLDARGMESNAASRAAYVAGMANSSCVSRTGTCDCSRDR